MKPEYSRVLYKLSGEVLKGSGNLTYDKNSVLSVCYDIAKVVNSGVQVCVMVGGGNMFRGRIVKEFGFDRISGDYMGMLATAMNAIAVSSVLHSIGVPATVLASVRMEPLCEFYMRDKAVDLMNCGNVVVCACGAGVPLFSTDTGAALRAIEMSCDIVAKGTSVDGVYSSDPKVDSSAKFYFDIKYDVVLSQKLGFVDQSAAQLLSDHRIGMLVFSIKDNEGSAMYDALCGRSKHTLVHC